MGTRQASNHLSLVSVLQTIRRQIRRKEEIYMQWTPGHSKHLGNEMADGSAFLGSQGKCFGPQWVKGALKEVHRKATEIGMVEPRPEFTPMQHSGWTGFRDILITAAEKVIDRGKQLVVGLPYSEESLREILRKRRLLDEKFSGLDGCGRGQETEERIAVSEATSTHTDGEQGRSGQTKRFWT